MDSFIYSENERKMNLCSEAELKLRTLSNTPANAQELKESQLLYQAHKALANIWDQALSAPIDSSIEWDACCQSVDHSINLIESMAQQLDAGKVDFQELKTPDNLHHLFVALKTMEIGKLKLKAYDKDEYNHLDQAALKQMFRMLNAAFCLLQTTYDVLKA